MTTVGQMEGGELDGAFKLFIRALAQSAYRDSYRAHKMLIAHGQHVTDKVVDYIERLDFADTHRAAHANLLNGLFSLLIDLDERRAAQTASAIIERGCPIAVEQRLKTICEFSLLNFRRYSVSGVTVLETTKLTASDDRPRLLDRWLSVVPAADLDAISRLYIVTDDDLDSAGAYMPVLFTIALQWSTSLDRPGILSRIQRSGVRRTLYHEIGHHVYRHTFGQDPEQEEEAERYARRMLRRTSLVARWLAALRLGCVA